MSDWSTQSYVDHWVKRLGLTNAKWQLVDLDPSHVTGEDGKPGHNDFVGVAVTVQLFHSRPLTEEDVVHELLHVRHPAWGEARIRRRTQELLNDASHRTV